MPPFHIPFALFRLNRQTRKAELHTVLHIIARKRVSLGTEVIPKARTDPFA